MLSEPLQEHALAVALEQFDAQAITAGKFEHQELTLEIDPARIVAVCRYLKDQQQFNRISSVTGVDVYPAEPRFQVVYHLHSLPRNQRVRLKCRLHGERAEIESVTSVWRGANWYERET